MSTTSSTSTASTKTPISSSAKKQRTLKNYITFGGVGLFTGCKSEITFCPAPAGSGINFIRVDLPGKPVVPASVEYVCSTPRCTILGKDGVLVQSVEHLMAALKACEIDNLNIELNAPEIPAGDGSFSYFLDKIEKCGVAVLPESKEIYRLKAPVFWSRDDVHLVALPSEDFRISYTLNYPNSDLLGAQFFTMEINQEAFKKEIAPSRTFALYEEIVPLIEQGNIKGGTLENGIIIKGDTVLNPEGYRFPNEPVRHKLGDLVGDISLTQHTILMHIIALRSGHTSNIALAKELLDHIKMEYSL